MSDERKYPLTYEVQTHPEGITAEEVDEEEGACDAIIVMPLSFPEDGSYSWDLITAAGKEAGKELEGDEIWKAWLMLTKHLSIRKDLREGKSQICESIFNQVSALLTQTPSKPELH